MKNLFDQCFRKVKFAIYILGGSIVLVLSGCQSPFPTKDVVECPIAEEQSSRFELVSTKYRNFYPLSFHVSEFSRPSGFKVFFKKGSFMGVDTEVPVWFGREWYKPWGNDESYKYCESLGKSDDTYYVWSPISPTWVFISTNGGKSFHNIFPKDILNFKEAPISISGAVKVIKWAETRVKLFPNKEILIEQAAHLIDSGCFLLQLGSARCDPVQVRSTRTFDQGKTWSGPVIVDKPILFNLSSK